MSLMDSVRTLVEQLGSEELETTGAWSMGQIYFHLAAALEGSVDGLPSGYPWIARLLIRPMRWFVTGVRFPPWIPIPAKIADKLDPPDGVDCAQQHARLLTAIDRFVNHKGELPAHPVLGKLSRSEWIGFHLRHCEHHLRFIVRS